MDMNQAAAPNPIDANRNGLIGKDMDRVDGRLKVTGKAPYAYEYAEPAKPAYGYILEAGIAKGKVLDIDTRAAEAYPGVLRVMTYRNAPAQAAWGPLESADRFARAKPQLKGTTLRHYGEPVAFVVAEDFETARAAARQIQVRYETVKGEFEFASNLGNAIKPKPQNQQEPDSAVGDFDAAFAAAPVRVDATYTTPFHIHAQMEPHAALAWWEGDEVTIRCSAQLLESAQKCVANTLQIPASKVHILSEYIGGGFGGKLPIYADALLAAMASRELKRPVKTALTRQQMFHLTTHRSCTAQRLRLGAKEDGTLVAIGHDAWSHCARFDNFYESAAMVTRSLYAAPNRLTRHRSLALDLPVSDSTRAPGEAVGMLALEAAMDELAHALKLDPIELRVRNEPSQDPEKKVPYSSRQLVACMRRGAEAFGWDKRKAQPAQVRDGRWLIGIGMAAASRGNFLRPSKCRVHLGPDGVLSAQMSMTDIGTGSYTIFTQIAAELLGLPPEQVRMQLGNSDFPETPGSGGSFGAASAGSGLYDACMALRAGLAAGARMDPNTASFSAGQIHEGQRSVPLATIVGDKGMEAEGEIKPGKMTKAFSQQAYGAYFAEVAVDMDTGEIRLRRMHGVFAAGRILNAKTARSQAIGAMIWGAGGALFEEGVIDTRYGSFVNQDLVHYHVPAHADIPAIDAEFLPEVDDKANPLKIKGVGELGICGAGAAIANAVFNATGVRVRDFPITLDKVLAGLQRV